MSFTVAIEDPRTCDVASLLNSHASFCDDITPADGCTALNTDELRNPSTTLFTIRDGQRLLGTCAIKLLSPTEVELKSMHVAEAARGKGAASELLRHVLDFARSNGITHVHLETGSEDEFQPARNLYTKFGFIEGGPFVGALVHSASIFMTLNL